MATEQKKNSPAIKNFFSKIQLAKFFVAPQPEQQLTQAAHVGAFPLHVLFDGGLRFAIATTTRDVAIAKETQTYQGRVEGEFLFLSLYSNGFRRMLVKSRPLELHH